MTYPFDMTLFLSGVLTGSQATQQRHLRQARLMQAAIAQRWQRDNPWTWRHNHVRWFFTEHLKPTRMPVAIIIGSRLHWS